MAKEAVTAKVKVKILAYVGAYEPNQEVEVSKEEAEALCKVTEVQDGTQLMKRQKAMLLSDYEKQAKKPLDASKMTQYEYEQATGMRGPKIKTPVDKGFEAKLDSIREGDEEWLKAKQAEAAAAEAKNEAKAEEKAEETKEK